MAIYKNREVQVLGPSPQANTPVTINVSYANGTNENVKLSDVRFTAAEKALLIKNYPNGYTNVQTVTEDDLTSVRVGVAPSFDTAEKDVAMAKAQHQKQVDISTKRTEALKTQAQSDINKVTPVVPVSPVVTPVPAKPSQPSVGVPSAPQTVVL
jgi:hypothetical protein